MICDPVSMMVVKMENYVEISIPPMKYTGICPQGTVMESNDCQIPNGGKEQRTSIDEDEINDMIWMWGSVGLKEEGLKCSNCCYGS